MTEDTSRSSRGVQRALLLTIILQSIGIRWLPMQGFISGAIICLVMASQTRASTKQLLSFGVCCGVFLALSSQGTSDPMALAYVVLLALTGALFALYVGTRWAEVEVDLLHITWWLSFHGLVSYLLYLALHDVFSTITLIMEYRILGIFVVSDTFEKTRATGLCWEPGLLQYVANLSLFLGIKHAWPRWKLGVSFATVVVTYSTTGIFALVPTVLYVLVSRRRSIGQWAAIAATALIVSALSFAMFRANIEQKLDGKDESGLVRLRDAQVGWDLLQEKPLLGHGKFDEPYLLAHSELYEIAEALFASAFLETNRELEGGYTNGIFAILAGYGVLFGGFVFWCFLGTRILQGRFKDRITLFAISMITFISEPITWTSWFFVVAISGIGYGFGRWRSAKPT